VSERYEHPHAGFSLTVTTPFALVEEGAERAVLALEAAGSPTLIVTVEALPADMRSGELADAGLEALARELTGFHVLDYAPAALACGPGVRTLSHHIAEGRAMVLEQWRMAAGGRGLTLSGSCPTLDYPALGEVLDAAAASLGL